METIQPYILGWLVPSILTAVAGFFAGLWRKARTDQRAEEERRASDRRTLDGLTVMVCRMAIYDEHFSVDEKVDAYRMYRAHGGNHRTKRYMDELLGEDADAWLARH